MRPCTAACSYYRGVPSLHPSRAGREFPLADARDHSARLHSGGKNECRAISLCAARQRASMPLSLAPARRKSGHDRPEMGALQVIALPEPDHAVPVKRCTPPEIRTRTPQGERILSASRLPVPASGARAVPGPTQAHMNLCEIAVVRIPGMRKPGTCQKTWLTGPLTTIHENYTVVIRGSSRLIPHASSTAMSWFAPSVNPSLATSPQPTQIASQSGLRHVAAGT